MGVHFPSLASKTIQNAGVGNSAEVIVFSSPALNISLDNQIVLVFWEVVCTLGAAQTTFAINLRRGTSASGTLVNVGSSRTTVASTTVDFAGVYFDTPGVVAGQQYSIGVNANGAAAAGTVVDGCIIVICL